MKKKISVFIVAVLCLVLCSCNEKKDEQTETVEALSAFSTFPESMPEFSTVNLEGDTVTRDIFSNAELTVVNLWATYCNPCVEELPELAKWEESMPDNVQLVGLMMDVPSEECEEYTVAKEIVDKTGAKYQHLAASKEFDDIASEVVGVPTTLFVDKEGNIVGEPIVGENIEGYKEFVEEYLSE